MLPNKTKTKTVYLNVVFNFLPKQTFSTHFLRSCKVLTNCGKPRISESGDLVALLVVVLFVVALLIGALLSVACLVVALLVEARLVVALHIVVNFKGEPRFTSFHF